MGFIMDMKIKAFLKGTTTISSSNPGYCDTFARNFIFSEINSCRAFVSQVLAGHRNVLVEICFFFLLKTFFWISNMDRFSYFFTYVTSNTYEEGFFWIYWFCSYNGYRVVFSCIFFPHLLLLLPIDNSFYIFSFGFPFLHCCTYFFDSHPFYLPYFSFPSKWISILLVFPHLFSLPYKLSLFCGYFDEFFFWFISKYLISFSYFYFYSSLKSLFYYTC